MMLARGIFIIFSLLVSLCLARTETVTKLEYWVLFSGGDARPMQMIVEKFNATHPAIQVKMKLIRWEQYYPTLKDSIASKNPPDVAIVHASLIKQYVDANAILNLAPYKKTWDVYPKNILDIIRQDDAYYAVPIDLHPQVLFFNKKYLAQAGLLDKNQNPIIKSGAEGFVEFLKTLKQKLPTNIKPLSTPTLDIYPLWIWYSLYTQQNNNGGYIQNNKASFNNKQGKRALEVLQKMRDTGVWGEEIHDEKGYNLFKFNNAATMVSGVWATWNFEQNKELEFGVASFPTFFDNSSAFVDSHTMVVPKYTDPAKTRAAMDFINWVSENSFQWALCGQVPAHINITSQKNFQELPNRKMYLKSANSGVFYPSNAKLSECNQVMKKILVDFMKNKAGVDETLDKAETQINQILNKK